MEPPKALLTSFLRQPQENLGLTARTPLSWPGHRPHVDFDAFQNLLGTKVNNSITRDSRQPVF